VAEMAQRGGIPSTMRAATTGGELLWVPAALDEGEGGEAWIDSKEGRLCGGAH
jgi:hypothetical protein